MALRGLTPGNPVSVAELSELLSPASSACRSCFGVGGRAAIVCQKSPKTFVVTKDGATLCRAFAGQHPLVDLALTAATASNGGGDGVKSVVIILHGLLQNIARNVGKCDRPALLREIIKMREEVLPLLRKHVAAALGDRTPDVVDDPRSRAFSLLSTSLGSREVASRLAAVAVDAVNAAAATDATALRRRFIRVCGRPVAESRVEEGVLLVRCRKKDVEDLEWNKTNADGFAPADGKRNFLLWRMETNKDCKKLDENWCAGSISGGLCSNQDFLNNFVSRQSDNVRSFASRLKKDFAVKLVLCNFGLPAYASMLLRSCGMTCLEHVDGEEMSDVADATKVLVYTGSLDCLRDSDLSSHHVGRLAEAPTKCVLGDEIFLRIKPENALKTAFQVVVCGPNASAVQQYAGAILRCIRVLQNNEEDIWVPVQRGNFETTLHQALQQRDVRKLCDASCPRLSAAARSVCRDLIRLQSTDRSASSSSSALQSVALLPLGSKLAAWEDALLIAARLLSIEAVLKTKTRMKEKDFPS